MNKINVALRRPLYAVAALALLFGVTGSVLVPSMSSAAAITLRSIKLSTSAPSATSVSYELTFTPATNAGSLAVDFCGDTPLIGATCAFAAGTVPDVASAAASSGTLTTPGSGTPKHTLIVTGLTMVAATPYTITFTGMANPTTATSFYARVITYTSTNATNYTPANTTGGATTLGSGTVDQGGVAMSTATQINLTARVMEKLSFCVYADDNGGGPGTGTCGDDADFEFGTGTPPTIDSLAVYNGLIDFNLSSNATNGVVVRIKGPTLTSGANTIAAKGASASAITAGTAAFGVQLPTSTTTGVGSPNIGQVDADANYDSASGYGLDTTNMATTYGDVLADTNGAPLNAITGKMTYGVTASITTPAGVYTATHELIATGTF